MTGNQDRAGRAAARLDAVYDRLDPMLDRAMDALDQSELKKGDTLAVQRFARGIETVARAARVLATLQAPPPKSPKTTHSEEDEVREHDRDDSPENLERLRAQIESRLDSIHAVIEAKRLDSPPVVRTDARDGEEFADSA